MSHTDAASAKRILLYEDDDIYAHTVAAVLTREGYHVQIATDFGQALSAIEGADPPHLLIADVVFGPGAVNGVAMARMARMKRRGIKVIFVTGFSIPPDGSADGDVFLTKPVSEDRLLAEVRQQLDAPAQ